MRFAEKSLVWMSIATLAAAGVAWADTPGATSRPAAGPAAANSPSVNREYTAGADTYVDEERQNTNFGSAAELKVGRKIVGASGYIVRTLVRFDVDDIPAGSTVRTARLWLYHDGGGGSLIVFAKRITSPWSESVATWNSQPNRLPPQGVKAINSGAGRYDWDVKAVVQGWVDNTYPQHGFMLEAKDEEFNTLNLVKTLRSRTGGNPPGGDPPVYLEVSYDLPPTATHTPTATPTRTSTATPTSTTTPTDLPTPTRTATATPTASATPTATATDLPTSTATATSTATGTSTPTGTSTATATAGPTSTGTAAASSTPSASPSTPPGGSPSSTATPPGPADTLTATVSATPTPSATRTTAVSATPTGSPGTPATPSATTSATAIPTPTAGPAIYLPYLESLR
jgi:hypothetical protein